MLRPSPNHGTQWLPNDDDDDPLPVLYRHIILALPQLNIIWSHCPILLPLLHADLKDDRFVLCGDIVSQQRLHSFPLPSCCCRTTGRSSSVLCRPLLWVILWLSFFWQNVPATANPLLLKAAGGFKSSFSFSYIDNLSGLTISIYPKNRRTSNWHANLTIVHRGPT